MPVEKGTPLVAVKQWETISNVGDSVVDKIKYFCGFQTYLAEEDVRKPSAIFVTTDDQVYAIGYNGSDNLLALEDTDFAKTINLTEPRKINGLSGMKIKKLTVSERFGAALTEDGKLLYWGMQMEMLQHEERSKNYLELPHFPRQDLEVAAMSCGGHSITFLSKNGDVLIWGCLNLQYSDFYEFEKIALPNDAAIVSVTSGWYHVALLDDKGRVETFGIGSVGELGYQWSSTSLYGLDYITPRRVQLPRKCVKMECGSNSTLFLLENGDVYACGNNLHLDYLCVGRKGHVFIPARVYLNDPIADIMAAYNWSGKQWQSRFTAMSKKGEFFKWGEEKGKKVPSKVTGVNSLAEIYVNFITPQAYGDVIRTERDVHQASKPSELPSEIAKAPEAKLPGPSTEGTEKMPIASKGMPKVSIKDPNSGSPNPSPAKPGIPSPAKPETPSSAKPGKHVNDKKPEPTNPDKGTANPDSTTLMVGGESSTSTAKETPSSSPPSTTAQTASSSSNSKPEGSISVRVKGQKDMTKEPEPSKSTLSKWPIFKSIQKSLAQKITKFLVFSGYNTSKRQEGFGAFVITKDDDVLSFGINTEEKLLGLEGKAAEEDVVEIPTKIQSLSGKNIKKIVIGLYQGAALSKNGSVFMWNQQSGPVLLETKGMTPIDVICGSKFILILTSDSNIYLNGEMSFEYEEVENKKIQIPNGVKIKSIGCGEWHGAFVSTDSEAYTFGHGVYDQLGYQQEPEDNAYEAKKVDLDHPCIKIACGVRSTVFLLKNGDVYACGSNTATDRLAAGQEESFVKPEKMNIPEPVVDLVAVIRNANYGARVDLFAAKSAIGKIYKWRGRNPVAIDEATTLLGAFEGLAIPQSMSMVNYEFQDGDLQEPEPLSPPLKDPTLESNESTKVGNKRLLEEDYGPVQPENTKDDEMKVPNAESKDQAESTDKDDTQYPGSSSYSRPDQDLLAGGAPKDDNMTEGSSNLEKEDVSKEKDMSGNDDNPEKPTDDPLGDPRYSDLKIKLSNGTIPAHKVLLYTKSSFFRHAISRNENIEELDLSAYKPKSVMGLMKHIYGVPIGEQVSIEDAADFQEMAEKDGGSSVLMLAKLLLYSSTLYDVVTTHLERRPANFKAKVLKAILPTKVFP